MKPEPIDSPDSASSPTAVTAPGIARARLALGLAQGLVLYALYHAAQTHLWPATPGSIVVAPMLLASVFVPILALSALGHLPSAVLWRWLLLATVLALGLGVYDSWRSVGAPEEVYRRAAAGARYPSAWLWLLAGGGFYVAQALMLAAAVDRRRIATYASYFDSAWKLMLQILFSCLFAGALWAVLGVGMALFDLVQLKFFSTLLRQSWFAIPVTVFAFACAMHLTDARPAIVRGIRSLLLALLSWLLPVAVLIVAGFLASLPFTGLTHLWETRHATALLLSATAILVVLINAVFQNGALGDHLSRSLRFSATLACGLLLPLVLIAVYALGLRVGDHGWTTTRIAAACCVLVAGYYAVGYAWAALRGPGWLGAVAPVNTGGAFLILTVLVAVLSPVFDPARLSVAHQLARLESGRQTLRGFDFDYLRFEGQRFGLAALERLRHTTRGEDAPWVRAQVERVLAKKSRWDNPFVRPSDGELRANLTAWPRGERIPESFVGQDWEKQVNSWGIPRCLRDRASRCDVYLFPKEEPAPGLLLVLEQDDSGGRAFFFGQESGAPWSVVATLPGDLSRCPFFRDKLRSGEYSLVTPRRKDIEVGGQRFPLIPTDHAGGNCAALGKSGGSQP